MKEPQKIKLTDSPTNKNVKSTPLPSSKRYPETIDDDDVYTKQTNKDEDNKQNNSKSISELESL